MPKALQKHWNFYLEKLGSSTYPITETKRGLEDFVIETLHGFFDFPNELQDEFVD